ncbi:4'-phosphopantetheinyl transferase family protein [Campylobacter lanienae]|uniref:4'-phosphopantetheinyl transferase family protein n=1 Tax=Campylobacter lanienae TaxID=75658 RepID=UPI003F0BD1E6
MKIEIYISQRAINNFKLYKKDKRRLKKHRNLNGNSGFIISRALKWRFKLKDHICISHKKNIAAIARCKGKIGIDIEELKSRNFNSVVEFCFNDDERALWQRSSDKILEFYKIWTAKEAFIKFNGLNFSDLKVVNYNHISTNLNLNFFIFNNYLITIVATKSKFNKNQIILIYF